MVAADRGRAEMAFTVHYLFRVPPRDLARPRHRGAAARDPALVSLATFH